MSETSKKRNNAAIAYGDVKANENGKGIIIEQGNYGLSKNEINELAGMEIKVEGYEIVLDEETGKVLRVKDKRTIGEVIDDRRRKKIITAMKKQGKDGIEH